MTDKSLILIIDDKMKNLQLLGSILKEEGHLIAVASDGQSALDFAKKRLPDLILLDIMMPKISGIEVCKRLKEEKATKEIPVIFISALNDVEDKLKGFEVGGVDFITKPFQKREVMARVKTHLELKEARNKIEDLYQKLAQNVEQARKIHEQFLPSELAEIPGVSLATYYHPAEQIGGDFYNIIRLDKQVIFYLADVTGHGLEASLLNIFAKEKINNFLFSRQDEAINPAQIIEFMNQKYIEEKLPAEYFICLLVGVLDLDTMKITFANAGFQLPPIVVDNKKTTILSCSGLPISAITDSFGHNIETLTFKEGMKILLTTDGIIEEKVKGEMYGEKRLIELLKRDLYITSQGWIEDIKDDFKKFSGSLNAKDDITLMLIQREYKY